MKLFHSVLLLTCLAACRSRQSFEPLIIEEVLVMNKISGASGIMLQHDTAWIVGDDATHIFRYNLSTPQPEAIGMNGIDTTVEREAKPVKHDFENAALFNQAGKRYLLALGSGTLSPYRDSALLLNIDSTGEQSIFSMHHCYNQLQQLTQTPGDQWNVEGVTTTSDFVVIGNRGNNKVIRILKKHFLEYITNNNSTIPTILSSTVQLPSIEGKTARLSGVCTLDDDHLLLSASVEDTPNWTQDGPIIGSCISIYAIREDKILASYLLQDKDGNTAKEKIESVDIIKQNNGYISCIAVCDNDNGTSKIFRLLFTAPYYKP